MSLISLKPRRLNMRFIRELSLSLGEAAGAGAGTGTVSGVELTTGAGVEAL